MPFVAKRVFGWEPVEITDDWGLRDIKSGMAYPLCGSLQCNQCGALFLDIRFTEYEISALYSNYRGEEYTNLRDLFEPGYKQRDAIIQQGANNTAEVENFLSAYLPPRPKTLDWGGDTGINTPFRSRSEIIHIFDISNKPTNKGVVRVDASTIASFDYDLIVLSHVLEHLLWPARTLFEIGAVMREDTVLYIETPFEDLVRLNPNAKNLHARKKYWHEHINFFSADSLRLLVDCCGMQMIDMRVMETEGGGKHWHVFSIACKLRKVMDDGVSA